MTDTLTHFIPNETNIRNDEVILVIKPRDGEKALSSTGLVDTRIFTGKNNVKLVKDPQFGHWRIKYDFGAVPPVFNQQFTSFPKALAFAKEYFATRNCEIVEVKD